MNDKLINELQETYLANIETRKAREEEKSRIKCADFTMICYNTAIANMKAIAKLGYSSWNEHTFMSFVGLADKKLIELLEADGFILEYKPIQLTNYFTISNCTLPTVYYETAK